MITMLQPSLAINSNDVPPPNYTMWDTWNAPKGATVGDVYGRIITAYSRAAMKGAGLVNVIINCHGYPGGLWVGGLAGDSINMNNLGILAGLKGFKIKTVWLVACNAAQDEWGKKFCRLFAQTVGSQVVASEAEQDVGVTGYLGFATGAFNIDPSSPSQFYSGEIDGYEGDTYLFEPDGSMVTYNEMLARGADTSWAVPLYQD
jgi:hypothetical protein